MDFGSEPGSITVAMHRNKLLELLGRYGARHPDDPTTARFVRFASQQPRCFERDCFDDGHVTGSAVVLNLAGTAMLMTHHAKLDRWLQLGGHADGETDPLAVACREATEESGLAVRPRCIEPVDLDIHAIPPRGADPEHLHYDVRFLFQVEESDRFTASDESLALAWVPLATVRSITPETSILRLAAKARAHMAKPA